MPVEHIENREKSRETKKQRTASSKSKNQSLKASCEFLSTSASFKTDAVQFPQELWQLGDLEWLDLTANELVFLPQDIATLEKLQLPNNICKLTKLEVLDVAENRLITSSLPTLLFHPTPATIPNMRDSLAYFDISTNQFTDMPPEFLDFLLEIGEIFIHNNPWSAPRLSQFTGSHNGYDTGPEGAPLVGDDIRTYLADVFDRPRPNKVKWTNVLSSPSQNCTYMGSEAELNSSSGDENECEDDGSLGSSGSIENSSKDVPPSPSKAKNPQVLPPRPPKPARTQPQQVKEPEQGAPQDDAELGEDSTPIELPRSTEILHSVNRVGGPRSRRPPGGRNAAVAGASPISPARTQKPSSRAPTGSGALSSASEASNSVAATRPARPTERRGTGAPPPPAMIQQEKTEPEAPTAGLGRGRPPPTLIKVMPPRSTQPATPDQAEDESNNTSDVDEEDTSSTESGDQNESEGEDTESASRDKETSWKHNIANGQAPHTAILRPTAIAQALLLAAGQNKSPLKGKPPRIGAGAVADEAGTGTGTPEVAGAGNEESPSRVDAIPASPLRMRMRPSNRVEDPIETESSAGKDEANSANSPSKAQWRGEVSADARNELRPTRNAALLPSKPPRADKFSVPLKGDAGDGNNVSPSISNTLKSSPYPIRPKPQQQSQAQDQIKPWQTKSDSQQDTITPEPQQREDKLVKPSQLKVQAPQTPIPPRSTPQQQEEQKEQHDYLVKPSQLLKSQPSSRPRASTDSGLLSPPKAKPECTSPSPSRTSPPTQQGVPLVNLKPTQTTSHSQAQTGSSPPHAFSSFPLKQNLPPKSTFQKPDQSNIPKFEKPSFTASRPDTKNSSKPTDKGVVETKLDTLEGHSLVSASPFLAQKLSNSNQSSQPASTISPSNAYKAVTGAQSTNPPAWQSKFAGAVKGPERQVEQQRGGDNSDLPPWRADLVRLQQQKRR
ncbi:hypothetical protein HK102_010451 [Quaeritorhiza haematococci]|nr:hypothetical protein HK102_010451 [Quaeritorhiza haematococci]